MKQIKMKQIKMKQMKMKQMKMKYEPLGAYLVGLPSRESEVTLAFEEVERIIGDKLPDSAVNHREWWANQKEGSRAPHWRKAGFKVETVNQKQRMVTFRRFESVETAGNTMETVWLENPDITKLTNAIEEQAPEYKFGDLQCIRQELKGLMRRSHRIFREKTIFDEYAYHYGGRTELQFNVGFENDDNDVRKLRHGLAISLGIGRSITEIDESIRTRFARLNQFIESHAEEFADFFMYELRYDSDESSSYHELRPVPPEYIELNTFIFIGKYQDPLRVSTEQILLDFDRLLPMYVFTERNGTTPFARGTSSSVSEPGLTRKPSSTTATIEARNLRIELRHNDIQFALGQYLIRRHGKDKVHLEFTTGDGKRVDLAVEKDGHRIYYEIKICVSAQSCIRQAIGQLLEYSYWPGSNQADRLIVVGEPELDSHAREYLEMLRNEFRLPIHYQQFDMKSKKLKDCPI